MNPLLKIQFSGKIYIPLTLALVGPLTLSYSGYFYQLGSRQDLFEAIKWKGQRKSWQIQCDAIKWEQFWKRVLYLL